MEVGNAGIYNPVTGQAKESVKLQGIWGWRNIKQVFSGAQSLCVQLLWRAEASWGCCDVSRQVATAAFVTLGGERWPGLMDCVLWKTIAVVLDIAQVSQSKNNFHFLFCPFYKVLLWKSFCLNNCLHRREHCCGLRLFFFLWMGLGLMMFVFLMKSIRNWMWPFLSSSGCLAEVLYLWNPWTQHNTKELCSSLDTLPAQQAITIQFLCFIYPWISQWLTACSCHLWVENLVITRKQFTHRVWKEILHYCLHC